jgi:hypothetical protein
MWDMRREISVRRWAKAEGSEGELDAGVESGWSAARGGGVVGVGGSVGVGFVS